MSSHKLEKRFIRLKQEVDRVQKEKRWLQLESVQMYTFWETSQRNLGDLRSRLWTKKREREEAKERHRVEIDTFKQKMNHLRSELHITRFGLKAHGQTLASMTQNQNLEVNLCRQQENLRLHEDLRERKLHNGDNLMELKLKYQVEIMELKNSYEKKIRANEQKCLSKLRSLIEGANKRWRDELKDIEKKMKTNLEALAKDHNRALRDIVEHLSLCQITVTAEQKELKEELAKLEEHQLQMARKFFAAQQSNRSLRASVQDAQEKLLELQKQQEEQAKARKIRMSPQVQQEKKQNEKEQRELTVQYELLLHRFEKVLQERDELLKKQATAIEDIQKENGLQRLVMERQLVVLTRDMEEREAQLCGILSTLDLQQKTPCRPAPAVKARPRVTFVC